MIPVDGKKEAFVDYPAIAKAYAEAVVSKAIPAGSMIILSCKRYLRMLALAEEPQNEFYFSPAHVIDYCAFAELFKHFESGTWEVNQIGPDGRPDPSIILEPWQIWVESAIHGFRKRITHERLVSTALEVVPRKNAKSLKACIAVLYDLCCSGQMAPEIVIAAASVTQSQQTVFGDLVKMINNEPELIEQFGVETTKVEIRADGDGKVMLLSSQGEKLDGLNPSLAIFEEGHGGASSVYRVVDSAFGARPNALRRMITTAGYRPEGPGYELIQDAQRILNELDEDYSFFAAIYTIDPEDYLDAKTGAVDYTRLFKSEILIAKCNPMYGVSLDPEKIQADMKKALRRQDLRSEAARTRFNLWVGSASSLIEASAWAACKRPISLEQFLGKRCWIGVDLATKLDMCSITLIFELEDEDDTIAMFSKSFLPRESPTALDPDIGDMLLQWGNDAEYLVLTDGVAADHDRVREEILVYAECFDVQNIACDPYQAHNTVQHLWDGNLPVVTYPNSAKTMTPPMDDLLARVATKRLAHDGNPVLAWCATNVHGERRGNGSIMPRKDKKNSVRKIDGFVAGCFANGVRIVPDEATEVTDNTPTPSPYNTGRVIGGEDRK